MAPVCPQSLPAPLAEGLWLPWDPALPCSPPPPALPTHGSTAEVYTFLFYL